MSHISEPTPRFLVGLVQKTRTKAPCTNSLSIVRGGFIRGVLSGSLLSGVFCPGWFLSACSPFCQNTYVTSFRNLDITLNFMFHMYDEKSISVTSRALYPLPLSQTVTP